MGRKRSSVFLRIFTVDTHDYFKLGSVRVRECPAGLELAKGARNRSKASINLT